MKIKMERKKGTIHLPSYDQKPNIWLTCTQKLPVKNIAILYSKVHSGKMTQILCTRRHIISNILTMPCHRLNTYDCLWLFDNQK